LDAFGLRLFLWAYEPAQLDAEFADLEPEFPGRVGRL